MTTLTEAAAERHLAARAFAPSWPGFVGLSVDVLLDGPAPPSRQRLRHGFLVPRAARVATVSGPPSPGLEIAVERMVEDLAGRIVSGRTDGTAGVRVALEAGTDEPGLLGLRRRWRVAHARLFRPPVAARGHLLIDVADAQPADGWLIPAAVVSALIDDAVAASEALAATTGLRNTPDLWQRAARDALADVQLATAARSLFVSAYAALGRRGVPRRLRDKVAAFSDRYVSRGRCPADDFLEGLSAGPRH